MSFPVLTGSEGAKWEMTLRGDSQSANISGHKVRLHVIIRFRAQGNWLSQGLAKALKDIANQRDAKL